MEAETLQALLQAFDACAWRRTESGYVPLGEPAPWLPPEPDGAGAEYLASLSPVMEQFLGEAAEFWAWGTDGRIESGAWELGRDRSLAQAFAIRRGTLEILLVELFGERHRARMEMVRHARHANLLAELLDRRGRLLEQAGRRKSEFLSQLSHELRTPLNAIIGFSTLLGEVKTGTLNERQRRFLGSVLSSAHHLLAVINEILDLSRIEAGVRVLNLDSFGVAPALDEAVASVRVEAADRAIRIDCGEIPPTLAVCADRVRFKQIAINLLSNAVKFSPDGAAVAVTAATEEERSIRVEIRDSGIGIPADEQSRVFDEFYRATNHRGRPGSGLGLAIARRLVEQHGGLIGFESQEGRGSVFWFQLPLPSAP